MSTKSKVNIVEIFDSIQGEGKYVGVRQIFVRVAGCPVKCPYCDTDYTPRESFSIDSVTYKNPITSSNLAKILNQHFILKNYHSISFTGGEPLLYPLFLKEFAEIAKADGSQTKLFLETSGHDPKQILDIAPYFDYISVDLKTWIRPFDEWADKLLSAIGLLHESKVYIKLLMAIDEDNSIMETAARQLSAYGIKRIWLQTIDNKFDAERIKNIQTLFATNNIEARFVPQIHKFLSIQ